MPLQLEKQILYSGFHCNKNPKCDAFRVCDPSKICLLSVELCAAAITEMRISYSVRTAAVLAVSCGAFCNRCCCHGRCCDSRRGRRCSCRCCVDVVAVLIDCERLTVTKRCAALGTVHKAVCIPGSEIQFIICVLDNSLTLIACQLVGKSAVPKCSFECHGSILLNPLSNNILL